MFSSSQIIEVELFLPLFVFIACLGIIVTQILPIAAETVEECIVVQSGSHKLRTKEYSWSVESTSFWRLLIKDIKIKTFIDSVLSITKYLKSGQDLGRTIGVDLMNFQLFG